MTRDNSSMTSKQLATAVEALQIRAAEVTAELQGAAQSVSEGRGVPDELPATITAWNKALADLVDKLNDSEQASESVGGFDAMKILVHKLHADEEKRRKEEQLRALKEEEAALRRKIAELEADEDANQAHDPGQAHEPPPSDVPDDAPSIPEAATASPAITKATAVPETAPEPDPAPETPVSAPESTPVDPPQHEAEAPRTSAAEEKPLQSEETAEERLEPPRACAWEEEDHTGTSRIERFLVQGRFEEAYWLTRACTKSRVRVETLAFAEAAFACHTQPDAQFVLTRFGLDLEALQRDRTAEQVAVLASLRAGMVAGWQNDILLQVGVDGIADGAWGEVLDRVWHTLRQCLQVNPVALHAVVEQAPTLTRAAVGEEASRLLDELPKRRIGYVRATQVQNLLLDPAQPLGKALKTVKDWADGASDTVTLRQQLSMFRKRGAAERMIEDADAEIRTPKQAKVPIEAKAKRALLSRIEDVTTLLSKACALAGANAAERHDTLTGLARAVARVGESDAPDGIAGAMLHRLRLWLRAEDTKPGRSFVEYKEHDGAAGLPLPGDESLLAAPDLPRDELGRPQPDDPGCAAQIAGLLEPVDVRKVLRAYAERGDLHLADRLVSALGQNLVPATPCAADSVPTDWDRAHQAHKWQRSLTSSRETTLGLLAELRTQQSLDPYTERDFIGRLQRLKTPQPPGAYRSAIRQIRVMEKELRERVHGHLDNLRAQVDRMELSESDRSRLVGLLGKGDTVTAEECLSLLRKGDELPDWTNDDTGDDLARFMAGVETIDPERASGRQGCSAKPWAEHYRNRLLTDTARAGLDSWDALCSPSQRGSEWQKHVPGVLRLLGLEGRASQISQGRQRGVLRLTAKLTSNDSLPGYVAPLGSAASTFTVLVVSEELRGRSPLEHMDRADNRACVILYLYPLGLPGRRKLLEQARTLSRNALVVDPAVVGWVAARAPRSLRALQRVTLPWTNFTPYTPYVAGLVPPEVFYGRSEEMEKVTDRLGALFLYGGRQLGKSALLRKVEADFPKIPDHVAVYLDLKARGVGEAEPAERIWSVLADELKRLGVLGSKVSTRSGAEILTDQIRRWLDENPERRILILADEADAFLTADSQAVQGKGGAATFTNVARLKGLMDATDRRFKVVFAGLHQVQRFSGLSNHPLAHGGPDVLIGPLRPAEAQRLVVEPMAAFGYRFERPDLVWRVLASTNYQACLVQIFCERLVTELRSRPIAAAEWPITVTEEDVRHVGANPEVHRSIAERLRLTINLEDRYRVLALIIALRSQQDGFQQAYDPDELLREAKERWNEGFRQLTATDLRIYLDEMVGLGLLMQRNNQRSYAVRSPNVVHMLGTRDDLVQELEQTEFSLPYDYNPRHSRRFLGRDKKGIDRYSPLTEQQLADATGGGVTALCLTDAHAPQFVAIALNSYAEARDRLVLKADATDYVKVLTEDAQRRTPSVIVVQARCCGLETLTDIVQRLRRHVDSATGTRRCAVVVIDPMARQHLAEDTMTRVIRPDRWTADSLRAWPECPFDHTESRRKLIRATGGWPNYVEKAIDLAARGHTLNDALGQMREQLAKPEARTRHIRRLGLSDEYQEQIRTWIQYLEAHEFCTVADIRAALEVGLPEVHQFLETLDDHGVLDEEDGCALDPVTFRALASGGTEE